MGRFIQPKGERGSLKWIQKLINEKPDYLNLKIKRNLGFQQNEGIQWLSPLADDGYAEYRDQDFIDRLDVSLSEGPRNEFWPTNGPQWDAFGRTKSGSLLLVEAKSHVEELVSQGTGASSESLVLIRNSLNETRQYLNSKSQADWASSFYQYTNRIAHLYLLRVLNHLPAYLIFIYFINDTEMKGPKTEEEWKGAIKLLQSYLGLTRHKLSKYIADIFIDVHGLT